MQTTSYTNDWIRFVVSNLEYVGHNKERSKKKNKKSKKRSHES